MSYDVAAYVWPAYTGDEPRALQFWEEGIGEWQSVKNAEKKFEGHSWPRKPLWGYVNEADPYVMEAEIAAAADHGVNTFIYDWYWYDRRPFLEQCLDKGFLGAKNRGRMKFYLMWANHDAVNVWDKRLSDRPTVIWEGSAPRVEFDRVCRRVIDKYFAQENYYKINGCPVFMIYDVNNLIRGLGGVDAARAALDDFRALTVKAGFPGLHLQLTIWRENSVNVSKVDAAHTGSTKDVAGLLGFDSASHYQFVHFTNVDRDYAGILPDVACEWKRIDEEYAIPYFPHVSIGWDNNPRFRRRVSPVTTGNTPELFEKALRMAKDYVDTHALPAPLITVNSWNEWTETSYLEPDTLNGYGYLEAVKRVFGA